MKMGLKVLLQRNKLKNHKFNLFKVQFKRITVIQKINQNRNQKKQQLMNFGVQPLRTQVIQLKRKKVLMPLAIFLISLDKKQSL